MRRSPTHVNRIGRPPSRLRRRVRADGGATIVEAAFVLPVLFLLFFGIMETGMLLRSYSSTANAARAAGRAGSVAGNSALADQYLLIRLSQEVGAIADEVEYVVVWHATGPGAVPPAACLPDPVATPNSTSVGQRIVSAKGSCNIYHRPDAINGAFDMALGTAANPDPEYYFGCLGPSDPAASHKVDCNWTPRDRKVTKTPRGGVTPPGQDPGTDYLGIYIRTRHEWVTDFMGSEFTITDQSITLLEPQGYSSA